MVKVSGARRGRALGARAASLCLASVDSRSAAQLSSEDRAAAEEDLITVGLDALTYLNDLDDLDDPDHMGGPVQMDANVDDVDAVADSDRRG